MSSLGPNFSARPTLRVNLTAIRDNYKTLQKLAGNAKVAASVKANAYGLGIQRVGKALYGAGCRNFFVATAGEGKALRQTIGDNASIYVFNGPAPQDLTLFFGNQLKPVINSLVQARIWANAIDNVRRPPFAVLHIDTGINRLGMPLDEAEKLSKNKPLLEKLNLDLVMSHLACAPDPDHPLNQKQLSRFQAAMSRFPVMPASLANSAGIYLGKPYHFQMVRPGIALYGGQATKSGQLEQTKSAVSLMAPVLQVRQITAGETVGYNAGYKADKNTTLATVAAGYADGIPVQSSGINGQTKGYATMQGRRVPIVGRVSMDLTVLDISGLKKTPRIGDWAEFRGENLEADARDGGILNYELLTRLGSRCRLDYLT